MNQRTVSRAVGLAVVVVFGVIAFTRLSDRLATWRAVPDAALAPADAIVVMAGGGVSTLHRTVSGIVLYEQHLAPLLVLSGPPDGPELEHRDRLARDLGLPRTGALAVAAGRTTHEEVAALAALLQARRVRTIILVTGAQHMTRAKRLFERRGLAVLPQAADAAELPTDNPEERFALVRGVVEEAAAVLYYRAAGYL